MSAQETVTVERIYKGPLHKLWAMWTTKSGLEAWYWPPPLVARVIALDVRVGGRYEIAADGLPHTSRGTYTEVVDCARLVYLAHIDFLEGRRTL